MWISSLRLINIKSFEDSGQIQFSKAINLLVGKNNAGKSTIVKSLGKLQNEHILSSDDIRRTFTEGGMLVEFKDAKNKYFGIKNENVTIIPKNAEHTVLYRQDDFSMLHCFDTIPIKEFSGLHQLFGILDTRPFRIFPELEPDNFIYFFLSNRRKNYYDLHDEKSSRSVKIDLSNLHARLLALGNPSNENSQDFNNACQDILGFKIGYIHSDKTVRTGVLVKHHVIPIEKMGEGVINILGLLSILFTDDNKLFLIEEIENDIHPEVLKKLLNLIIEKKGANQFVISTHSNIVLKYLGALPDSKVFHVNISYESFLPTSIVKVAGNTPTERKKLLEDLGYDLSDYDLWEGYLFMEESSAEEIVMKFLIPWFVPELTGRLRTISAKGVTNVEPTFEDFNKLFVFTHLENSYKDKVWVVVDGDATGMLVIEKMKDIYVKRHKWKKNQFQTFSKPKFEDYYPAKFQENVKSVFELDNLKRRDAKAILLNEVKKWLQEDPSAKKALKESASEIISLLKKIAKQLNLK